MNNNEHNFDEEYYEPTEEELREVDEYMRQVYDKEDKDKSIKPTVKNRLFFDFKSESHWEGWLRVNGIIWNQKE